VIHVASWLIRSYRLYNATVTLEAGSLQRFVNFTLRRMDQCSQHGGPEITREHPDGVEDCRAGGEDDRI
jgi:hypothetical protein